MANSAVKISIIIPVYNVEEYLDKCISSCFDQDLPLDQFEVIAVNDGSKDRSLDLLNALKRDRFGELVIVDKPNGGVSSARNEGLKKANGEFVWFIDSDDWIEQGCLSRLLKMLAIDKLDALQISMNRIVDGKIDTGFLSEFDLTTPVLEPEAYVVPEYFEGFICGTIFKRSIIVEHQIWFDETMKNNEDLVFTLRYVSFVSRIKRINYKPYFYLYRENSACATGGFGYYLTTCCKLRALGLEERFSTYYSYTIPLRLTVYINENLNRIPWLIQHLKQNDFGKVKYHPNSYNLTKFLFRFYNINAFFGLYLYRIVLWLYHKKQRSIN